MPMKAVIPEVPMVVWDVGKVNAMVSNNLNYILEKSRAEKFEFDFSKIFH